MRTRNSLRPALWVLLLTAVAAASCGQARAADPAAPARKYKPTWESIDREFARLKRMARSRGVAVGIAHPFDVTLSYLESVIDTLPDEGFRLVTVGEAIARGGHPAVQSALAQRPADANGSAR